MSKQHRTQIYEYLFKEGVMVAKKDFHAPKHPQPELENIPNLEVIKALQVIFTKIIIKTLWKCKKPKYKQQKFESKNFLFTFFNNFVLFFVVAEIKKLREGTVRLASLLLVLDQRRYRVPENVPASALRNRSSNAQASNHDEHCQTKAKCWTTKRDVQALRGPIGIPSRSRWSWQEDRCWSWRRWLGIPWWIRSWQSSSINNFVQIIMFLFGNKLPGLLNILLFYNLCVKNVNNEYHFFWESSKTFEWIFGKFQ